MAEIPSAVTGHHWLVDLSGCTPVSAVMEDAHTLERLLPDAARSAGMRVVGQTFHQFLPNGVTGAVILSESHLTVHTWPESKFVAIDVYVCNFNRENFEKGKRLTQELITLFAAAHCHCQLVARRSVDAGTSLMGQGE